MSSDVSQQFIPVDDFERMMRRIENELDELKEQVNSQQDRIDDLEVENERLRERWKRTEERTDLLQHVKQSSALAPEERAAILIQTLHNKAVASEQRGEPAQSELDANQGVSALGGSIDRTLMYSTFEKAVELVGDEAVLQYKKEDRGAAKNSRLLLNLEAGELPATVAGHEIGVEA